MFAFTSNFLFINRRIEHSQSFYMHSAHSVLSSLSLLYFGLVYMHAGFLKNIDFLCSLAFYYMKTFFFRSLKMELLENFSNEDFQETSTYCFVCSQYKVVFFSSFLFDTILRVRCFFVQLHSLGNSG